MSTTTTTTAATDNLPPRLTDVELKAVVKDLNKKDKFEEACVAVHAQVTHTSPIAADGVDELFAAVLRVGTVLKTRHAEGSAAWRFGLRLFRDAVEGDGTFTHVLKQQQPLRRGRTTSRLWNRGSMLSSLSQQQEKPSSLKWISRST